VPHGDVSVAGGVITAAQLAERVRARSNVRITETFAASYLALWAERGIAEEVEPGRFRLTAKGRALGGGLLETEAAA
jgi:hypothetical protein